MKWNKAKPDRKKNYSGEGVPKPGYLPLFSFKRGIPFILMFVMILAIFLIRPVKGIALSTENDLLFFFPEKDPYEFAIIYDHSVMRTEVKDVFTIEEGEILLLRTEYESFGAGLPTEAFEKFTKVDGRYINEGMDVRIPEIRMRTGKTTNHRLIYNEETLLSFDDFIESGSLILIEEKSMTTLESLFY